MTRHNATPAARQRDEGQENDDTPHSTAPPAPQPDEIRLDNLNGVELLEAGRCSTPSSERWYATVRFQGRSARCVLPAGVDPCDYGRIRRRAALLGLALPVAKAADVRRYWVPIVADAIRRRDAGGAR